VRTELVDQAETPLGIAKRQHPLRQQLQFDRRPTRFLNFLGQQRRQPVTAEQLAHRRAITRLRQQIVLFFPQHVLPLRS
jgi:hypothetical protein